MYNQVTFTLLYFCLLVHSLFADCSVPSPADSFHCPNECNNDPCSFDETECCIASTYHYPYGPGCNQCQNGFFQKDYNYPCLHCQGTFGDECLHCQDFNGCAQCSQDCTRTYDHYCGLWYCHCIHSPTRSPVPAPTKTPTPDVHTIILDEISTFSGDTDCGGFDCNANYQPWTDDTSTSDDVDDIDDDEVDTETVDELYEDLRPHWVDVDGTQHVTIYSINWLENMMQTYDGVDDLDTTEDNVGNSDDIPNEDDEEDAGPTECEEEVFEEDNDPVPVRRRRRMANVNVKDRRDHRDRGGRFGWKSRTHDGSKRTKTIGQRLHKLVNDTVIDRSFPYYDKDKDKENFDIDNNITERRRLIPLGSDTRSEVRNTPSGLLLQHVGQLRYTRNSQTWRCTATIIAPRYILTAAHCVHSGGSNGDWFSNFQFCPRMTRDNIPTCISAWPPITTTGWTSSRKAKYDFAILRLSSDPGLGYASFGYSSSKLGSGNTARLRGYAVDRGVTASQYYSSGKVYKRTYNTYRSKSIDTAGWTSGAGWYAYSGSKRVIYGVHKGWDTNFWGTRYNYACRLRKWKFDFLCKMTEYQTC